MIRGIHHTSISTGDLDRMLGFYRDLVGIEVLFEVDFSGAEIEAITALPGAKGRVAMLRAANAHIELFEYARPVPETGDPDRPVCNHGLTHICFDVVDLPSEYARLTAAGVPFHCEPQWLGNGTVLTTYARDPDGNVVEFQEILNPKSRMAMTF
ncbi:VOC family protein [Emcibacter sp. SYSU 3D8]|uniref:VOC family protein n=1 Tax=Emcibacter sp. SYSU 3D8 TaxID=3133969 RepID=UPI0031FEE768